ncbi:MAG: phosphoribosylglycinamide formyltransferase [Actinomycetota bacterium]|nr:phosphoribosylglycinamide formyltransferase [Actinomycetota bacterium]
MSRLAVGVLASGAGTNLQAVIDTVHGRGEVEVAGVAGNRGDAPALQRARAAGIESQAFELDAYGDRTARDLAMAEWMQARGVGLVVLAGYMQLLGPEFLARFPGAVINVHPALLPAFRGLGAIEQALLHGTKVFGVTVHFVDEGVDSGPIILQRAIELPDARDVQAVHDRLRPLEHELLPEAIRLFARGALSFDPDNPRRVIIDR